MGHFLFSRRFKELKVGIIKGVKLNIALKYLFEYKILFVENKLNTEPGVIF